MPLSRTALRESGRFTGAASAAHAVVRSLFRVGVSLSSLASQTFQPPVTFPLPQDLPGDYDSVFQVIR